MPNYSYICQNCDHSFEQFFHLKDYTGKTIKCVKCGKKKAVRDFMTDALTQSRSVKKSDTEITLGHLAHRNTEKMSEDEKRSLYYKHNSYRQPDENEKADNIDFIDKLYWDKNKKVRQDKQKRKELKQKVKEAIKREKPRSKTNGKK